jgi:hypothetical protein
MKQSQEEKRKSLFCFYTARGYAPEDAAKAAGYPPAECGGQAALLLGQAQIRRRCKKLARELKWCSPEALARRGWNVLRWRGRTEPPSCAGRRRTEQQSRFFQRFGNQAAERRGLGNPFFDRLKALSLLAELGGDNADSAGSLLDALGKSARKLEDVDEDGPAV